jgi:hypothetical protein
MAAVKIAQLLQRQLGTAQSERGKSELPPGAKTCGSQDEQGVWQRLIGRVNRQT